jgi:predicted nucleic acid-binding protein
MIAADSSSLVSYFSGDTADDVAAVRLALASGQLALPLAVVTEVLSDRAAAAIETDILKLATLPILDGYWHRAGVARRTLQIRGLKARLGDALIAQSCIDHDVALITRDKDFRHFAKHCGLKLA